MNRVKIFRQPSTLLLLITFCPIMLSENFAQTSEEWAAIGEEYLQLNSPDYYYAADAYIYAGKAAIEEENYVKAKEYFERALDINKSINDDLIIGRANDGLGEVADKMGDLETAIDYYLIAAQKYLQINEYLKAGWTYFSAGQAAWKNNDFLHAEEYTLNAADAFNRGDYQGNVPFCYLAIALCAHEFKDFNNAFKYINMSAEKYVSIKEYSSAGYAYDFAGNFARESGDCDAALEYWTKAKNNYDLAGKPYSIPTCELEIIVDAPKDYDKYYQGDAILLKGKIKYGDSQIVPTDSKVILDLSVPNHFVSIGNRTTFIKTDNGGNFSVLPFAGWNIGEYTLVMHVRYWLEAKNKYVTADKTIAFEVITPPPTDIRTQLDKIVQRYKHHPTDSIKWGPIHENPPSGVPECMFGSYNNLNCTATDDLKWKDFVCGAYQQKVLNFFNSIRFNEDPEVRNLLKGLDYGPITRGIPLLTSHHAVVLYVIGTEWHQTGATPLGIKSVVFDPWPKQKPEIYNIQEFAGGNGFVRVDEPMANPDQIFSGYPITNAVICANFEGSQNTKSNEPKTSVIVECPVNLLVTNSEGKKLGMITDTNFVEEFSAHLYRAELDGNTVGWYLGLTENIYEIDVLGKSAGSFRIQISGESVGGQLLDYGEQSINKNSKAYISLNDDNPIPILTLADGSQITPEIIPTGLEEFKILNDRLIVMDNYPNPFNPITTITYSIPNNSKVVLKVYYVLGNEIETLINEEKPVGTYELTWDAASLPSGVYFYQLKAGSFVETRKMLLLK